LRKAIPESLVAAVSASCFSEDVEKARQAGCDDHIAKPLRRSDIIDTLAKHGFTLHKLQSAPLPFLAEIQLSENWIYSKRINWITITHPSHFAKRWQNKTKVYIVT
jgi:hypothetical protein